MMHILPASGMAGHYKSPMERRVPYHSALNRVALCQCQPDSKACIRKYASALAGIHEMQCRLTRLAYHKKHIHAAEQAKRPYLTRVMPSKRKTRDIGRGGAAHVRWRAAQRHPLAQPRGQAGDALGHEEDVVADEAAQGHRVDGAVQLWQRVEHDRLQAGDAVARPRGQVLISSSACMQSQAGTRQHKDVWLRCQLSRVLHTLQSYRK